MSNYEHYLVMLQEKNKLLSKLRQKGSHQIELEKREQGFSLYLNGANLNKSRKVPSTSKGRPKTIHRTSKTAGESEVMEAPTDDRAKTAPSKRKSWVCDSLELMTEDGEARHVPVPGILSGSYDEDFEPSTDNHELSLSFQDISILRKSLEKDSLIFPNIGGSTVANEYYSSDSSCNEELDSPEASSPSTTPPVPFGESSVVLEFESNSHSTVSIVSQPTTAKNIVSITNQENPSGGIEHPNLLETANLMSQTKETTEFRSEDPSMAPRLLSAVRRKQTKPLLESTQDIIDAVSAENKQLDHHIQVTASATPLKMCDEQAGNTCKSSPLSNVLNSDPPTEENVTNILDKQEPQLKNSSPSTSFNPPTEKTSSRFKPVLVNRYKVKPVRHYSPIPDSRAALIDERPGDSLTEYTLSIITAKVRKMDVSKQRKLLDMLSTLDAPLPSPLPTPTTQTHVSTPPHIPTTQSKASTPPHIPTTQSKASTPPHIPTTQSKASTPPHIPTMQSKASTPQWLEGTHTEEVHHLRGLDIAPPHRPCSTRTTGLRAGFSQGTDNNESKSGRVSELSGELKSGLTSSASDTLLPNLQYDHGARSNSSNPCLFSQADDIFVDEDPANQTLIGSSFDENNQNLSPIRPPRLKTATIAKGHQQMPCVDQSSGTSLNVGDSLDNSETLPTLPPPVISHREPELKSDSRNPRSECLESIQKFDRSHLGQIKSDLQDDILESFLSEYREGKESHSHSESQPLDEEFLTPELPSGRELILHILSTWGDRFYVGLTGVELFTEAGERATVEQITASPSDINMLPEYSNDPRVVKNLLDGVNQTRDDLHMWLAPFTPGQDHTVTILFPQPTIIALIRLWNYNKSRIHSARGARQVEITLDQQTIFHGEVARGDNCETILFTTNEDILYLVSQHDTFYQSQSFESGFMHFDSIDLYRPPTSETTDADRPLTTAHHNRNSTSDRPSFEESQDADFSEASPPFTETHCPEPTGHLLQISLTETWGGSDFIGLTGIAVLTSGEEVLQLRKEQLSSEIDGQRSDSEVASLLDGVNMTCDVEHMWIVPFDSSQPPTLTLSLDAPTHITGLLVWNYNASAEDSYSGVKVIHVYLDSKPLTPPGGWLTRRAPGHVEYHYQQLISFIENHSHPKPPLDGASFPRGFVFQLQLLSSWGDPYYIGLIELEMYDATGHVIPLTIDNIAAYPDSVNQLPGVLGDIRTPDKLIDGVRGTEEAGHQWLAPILPGVINNVYVIFNEPWSVSQIRLYNYGKTPSRGVREIAVLVDSLLVFSGTVPRASNHARGILPTLQLPLDPFIVHLGEKAGQETASMSLNDVQLTNNFEVVCPARKTTAPAPNQGLRPTTCVTIHSNRHQNKHW